MKDLVNVEISNGMSIVVPKGTSNEIIQGFILDIFPGCHHLSFKLAGKYEGE